MKSKHRGFLNYYSVQSEKSQQFAMISVEGTGLILLLLCASESICQRVYDNVETDSRFLLVANSCRSCECGRTTRHLRIVGGRPAQVNGFPWLAAIVHKGAIKCGGTLLNDRYVMTAAHCLKGIPWREAQVVLGEHDQSEESGTERRRIKRILFHPRYTHRNYDNDVALIRMESPVKFTEAVGPACLPQSGRDVAGETGLAAGWGRISDNGPTSTVLREVDVHIYARTECQDKYYMAGERLTGSMMCAGNDDGSKDTCQGDSGGPLMLNRSTMQMEVVGIISWGMACGMEDFPGIYTNISQFVKWIAVNTRDACSCRDG